MSRVLKFGYDSSADFHQEGDIIWTNRTLWRRVHQLDTTKDGWEAYQQFIRGEINSQTLYNILIESGIPEFYLQLYLIIPKKPVEQPKDEQKDVVKPVKPKKKEKKLVKKRKAKARRKRQRNMRLKDDTPYMIPYNVDLNDGESEKCVERVINPGNRRAIYPGDSKRQYTGKTVEDLIEYCEEIQRPLILKNVFGRTIYENDYKKLKNYPTVNAVCFNEHLYPVQGSKLKLNDQITDNMISDDYIYFQKGPNCITEGVHKDREFNYDIDFIKGSWDPESMKIVKNGIRALYYSSGAKSGYTIDCGKCYYTTATDGSIGVYGIPSIFDRFKDYTGVVYTHGYYLIKKDEYLVKYGITTNVVGGRTLKVLLDNGVKVVVNKELICSKRLVWESEKISEIFENKKKDFNMYNGCTGKVDINLTTKVCVPNEEEREAIMEDYSDIECEDDVLVKRFEYKRINNLLHRYSAVVDAASAKVLSVMFSIGEPVTKIVTDSLTFECPVVAPIGWKVEDFKYRGESNKYLMIYKVKKSEVSKNRVILGAPGTGKTYTIKKEGKYDYAASFTNKAAINQSTDSVKGQTLHALFNIESNQKFTHLTDKTVWVDEISQIPRFIWGYILDAYVNYNTKFIFSGDFNQTAPVGEQKLFYIPFLGQKTELTKDYRNSQSLVELRNDILNRNEVVITKSTEMYPLINIAYTNKTCGEVNKVVVEANKFIWGGVGTKVFSKVTIKNMDIVKNETYKVESVINGEIKLEGVDYTISKSVFDSSFVWGYCGTVHKSQGDTYHSDIGIHDWEVMPIDVKYTAITRVKDTCQLRFY